MREVMYIQSVENGELIQFDASCRYTRNAVRHWLEADQRFTFDVYMNDDMQVAPDVYYQRDLAKDKMYELGIFAHKWHGRDTWRLVPEIDSIYITEGESTIKWVQDKEYPNLTQEEMQEVYGEFQKTKTVTVNS